MEIVAEGDRDESRRHCFKAVESRQGAFVKRT
jgi:hypothetical protein